MIAAPALGHAARLGCCLLIVPGILIISGCEVAKPPMERELSSYRSEDAEGFLRSEMALVAPEFAGSEMKLVSKSVMSDPHSLRIFKSKAFEGMFVNEDDDNRGLPRVRFARIECGPGNIADKMTIRFYVGHGGFVPVSAALSANHALVGAKIAGRDVMPRMWAVFDEKLYREQQRDP